MYMVLQTRRKLFSFRIILNYRDNFSEEHSPTPAKKPTYISNDSTRHIFKMHLPLHVITIHQHSVVTRQSVMGEIEYKKTVLNTKHKEAVLNTKHKKAVLNTKY